MSAQGQETNRNLSLPLPSTETLKHCAKLSVVEDKPIMMDYWADSCDKQVLIGT
jgi:hypothetical protein